MKKVSGSVNEWTRCVCCPYDNLLRVNLFTICLEFYWYHLEYGALHYVYMIWFIILAQPIRNKLLYSIKWKAKKKNRTNKMEGKSCNWSCKFEILIWIILCLDIWFLSISIVIRYWLVLAITCDVYDGRLKQDLCNTVRISRMEFKTHFIEHSSCATLA